MTKDEFIQISLHMLLAHTVICSLNPGFQVAEGLMDMFQLTGLHHLVRVTFLCQFVVADEPVGLDNRASVNVTHHKPHKRGSGAIGKVKVVLAPPSKPIHSNTSPWVSMSPQLIS